MNTHAADVVGVAVLAFTTATGAAVAVEADVVLQLLVGIGSATIAGYFAARVQTEKSLTRVEMQIEEMRRIVDILHEELIDRRRANHR